MTSNNTTASSASSANSAASAAGAAANANNTDTTVGRRFSERVRVQQRQLEQRSNVPKTMETRSHKATAVASAAAALGLTVTSTQRLRGSGGRKETAEQTRNVKRKTAKVEERTTNVKKKTDDMQEENEKVKQRIVEARKKLDSALGRKQQLKEELEELGVKISVDEDGIVKDAVIPPLEAAVGPMIALGMPLVGKRQNRVGKPDQKILSHTHEAATAMQRLTGSDLTEGDIQKMDSNAQYYGTDLEFGGYKITDETMTNDRNNVVNKNCHLVGKARYEHWGKNGTGIALQNATLCKNLIVGIPNMAARYPSMSRCRKDSFDMFQPEDYDGNYSYEELLDLLAQSLGFKHFRDFQTQITSRGELKGMRSVRLDGEKEVTSRKGLSEIDYNKLGYRFRFKDGNDTKFDVN